MPINSRAKGGRIERELCQKLREVFGWEARRSVQFAAKAETADLVVRQMPNLFIESKGVEKLSVHPVMERAVQEAGSKLAVLAHRKNRTGWLLTMRLEDVLTFCEMVVQSRSIRTGQSDPTLGPLDMT